MVYLGLYRDVEVLTDKYWGKELQQAYVALLTVIRRNEIIWMCKVWICCLLIKCYNL